jgi:hypothetical protein
VVERVVARGVDRVVVLRRVVVLLAVARRGVVILPRNEAPWRWATRYTEDSPMLNERAIFETGVFVFE